jgi:hypothetical protein
VFHIIEYPKESRTRQKVCGFLPLITKANLFWKYQIVVARALENGDREYPIFGSDQSLFATILKVDV